MKSAVSVNGAAKSSPLPQHSPQHPKRSREDEALPGVPIDEAVAPEHAGHLILRVNALGFLMSDEWILLPGNGGRLAFVSSHERPTDELDDICVAHVPSRCNVRDITAVTLLGHTLPTSPTPHRRATPPKVRAAGGAGSWERR